MNVWVVVLLVDPVRCALPCVASTPRPPRCGRGRAVMSPPSYAALVRNTDITRPCHYFCEGEGPVQARRAIQKKKKKKKKKKQKKKKNNKKKKTK